MVFSLADVTAHLNHRLLPLKPRNALASALAWVRADTLCVLLGIAAFALGALVYVTDRPAHSAVLIPNFAWTSGLHVFGSVGQWLPSFVHPLAFSLFTAAASPARAAPRYGVCAAWGLVNLVFEIGQHAALKTQLVMGMQDVFGSAPFTPWLGHYFLRGTFDVADMTAVFCGALTAAALLHLVQPLQERNHAP
jgi:hypothetical protein